MKQYSTLTIIIFSLIFSSLIQLKASDEKQNITTFNGSDLKLSKKSLNPILLDDLPEDFPEIIINTVNNPTPGYIFLECFQVSTPDPNYLIIMNEKGEVVDYIKAMEQGADFKMQANGRFSFASRVELGDRYQAGPVVVQNIRVQHNILNDKYEPIDTVQMQNGFLADMHEFVILPNGNYLAVAYENFPVDMSELVEGGNPNADVVCTVFQELDKDKNCVFQWRSLDFIPILAAKDDLTKATFEHVHGNSMFYDSDGNMIVSFPTIFEVSKINMINGDLMWRFGGDYNQFKVNLDNELDAPNYFRMQHDAHRLSNGNLLLFDNAVQKTSGWNTRAVEYSISEGLTAGKPVATLQWEYKRVPPITTYAMGSAQRLKSGNTLINWGLMFMGTERGMTEVTPEGEIAFEMTFPKLNFSYRAHKYDLPACQPQADIDKFEIVAGNTYKFEGYSGDNFENAGIDIYFSQLDGFMYNNVNAKRYDCAPLDPEFEGEAPVVLACRYEITPNLIDSFEAEIVFKGVFFPRSASPESLIVYYRETPNQGVFTPLETEYFIKPTGDYSIHNYRVKVSEFGEYIIGFKRTENQINPPTLQYPMNNFEIENTNPVKFVWSSTGRYDDFDIQVASDSDFNNIVYEDSNVKIPIITKGDFEANSKYYWRTRTNYLDITSDWSEIYSFNLSDEFLNIKYPIGGEVFNFYEDNKIIVEWATNSVDSVKIELFRAGQLEQTISEKMYSYFGKVLWELSDNIVGGNDYTIRITNLNNEFISESGEFTIDKLISVQDNFNPNFNMELSPNPANDFVNIKFSSTGDTKIILYNILGMIEQVIYEGNIDNNSMHNLNISTGDLLPGVYYCIMSSGDKNDIQKFIKVK